MGGSKVNYPAPSASEVALQNEQVAALKQQNQMLQESAARTKMLEPLFWEASGIAPQYDDKGNITGFQKSDPTQAERDYQEILNLELDRTKQALAGDLPVNPAWTKQKETTLANTVEGLRRQGLKPGDTPYDAAMAELSTSLEGTEYGLRSGDVGLYEGLSMARGQDQDRRTQQLLAQYSLLPAGYASGGSSFGQLAQGYNTPLSLAAYDREGQYKAALQNAQSGGNAFMRNVLYGYIHPMSTSAGQAFGSSMGTYAGSKLFGTAATAASAGCWVAAAIYGPDTTAFRLARHWINVDWPARSLAGRCVRAGYWAAGPTVAGWVRQSAWLRAALRPVFDRFVTQARRAAGDARIVA